MNSNLTNSYYLGFLDNLKKRVAASRYRAALSVNKELILLYHHIGTEILRSQYAHGWGAKVIEQLSRDLKIAFPESKGFSVINLKYMRKFAEEYRDVEFVQETLAQLTWYHNVVLLNKVADKNTRLFYLKSAIEHGWSSNVMIVQIETALHKRKGAAITKL